MSPCDGKGHVMEETRMLFSPILGKLVAAFPVVFGCYTYCKTMII